MIKLNNSNWVMWKSMIEDFLIIKDLSDNLEGEEARPKDIFNLEWNKMKKGQLPILGNGLTHPQVTM